jgi:predicted Ser/Thr protein kinase
MAGTLSRALRKNSIKLSEELRIGGQGQVYRGTFRGKECAVKKLQLALLQLDKSSQQEQEMMLELSHPNIAKLLYWEDKREFR